MKINEENYIRYLRNKNEKALEYVIDNYGGLIKSIVKKHLCNTEEMQEECINDVLMAIWNGVDNFDENRSSFKNWISGISKFKSIDYQRKYYSNLKEESMEDIDILSRFTTEDEILKDSIDEKLEKILMELKDNEREIFLNYYLEDKKVHEIAGTLDVKPTLVYNSLSRTRKKLRLKFKETLVGGK